MEVILKEKENHMLYARWIKNEAYTKSTVEMFDHRENAHTEYDYRYFIETIVDDIEIDCDVIAVGYNNGSLVYVDIKPYSNEVISYEFVGDEYVDEIKILLWENTSLIKPFGIAEDVPDIEWKCWKVSST